MGVTKTTPWWKMIAMAAVVAIMGGLVWQGSGGKPATPTDVLKWGATVFVVLLEVSFIWGIWIDKIDLSDLIKEIGPADSAKASMSRLQLLIFTFVIATIYLILAISGNMDKFPEVSTSALGLLGISGGSYLISKGIQTGSDPNPPQQSQPQGPGR